MMAFIHVLDRIAKLSGLLANIVIWILTFTVTYSVVMRSLGLSTMWAAEVSMYLMVALAFFGVGATQRADGHFRVTFFRDLCSPQVRRTLDVIALAISVLFGLAFTVGAWNLAAFSKMLNLHTSTLLEVPQWMLQSMMIVGGFLFIIATMRDLIFVLRYGSRSGQDSNTGEVI